MTDASRLKATIFVGNLDQAVSKDELHRFFETFGDIVEVNLPKPELPSSHDAHRGFGYIEFEQAQDAREAIDNFEGAEFYGKYLRVAPAKPQKDQNEGLGSKTAIWEQEGWIAQHGISEEDRQAVEPGEDDADNAPLDPTAGLAGLDEAGPKQA